MTCPTDMVARAPGLPKDHAACIMRLASPNRDSSGAWLSPVERTVRDREVESPNLSAPTSTVVRAQAPEACVIFFNRKNYPPLVVIFCFHSIIL